MDNVKRHVVWDNLMALFNKREFDEVQSQQAEAIGLIAATNDGETIAKILEAVKGAVPASAIEDFHADPTTNESVLKAQAKLAEQEPSTE